MHVSLSRRYHRFDRSMQVLLWICFGVLAVIPWQAICGQDQPAAQILEEDEARMTREWIEKIGLAEEDGASTAERVRSKTTDSRSGGQGNSITPLIIRGQGPMEMPPPPMQQMGGPEPDDGGFLFSDTLSGRSGQSLGNLFRIGGFTGPAIGRKQAIYPIEMMPYSLIDNNLFFVDLRAFKGSADTWGANLGGGYRRYLPTIDRILGVNAFFDYDTTSGPTFRQIGFGAEFLGQWYDIRSNAYLPTGTSDEQISLVNLDGTQRFVGHFLQVNQQRTVASALHGFDGEIGFPIPGAIPQRHDLRVFGGGYWYESNMIESFGGWRTRVQASPIPSIQIQLEVTHDPQFKTNVVFGGSWSYGGFRQSPGERKSQYDRMTTPVIRNYNMIVGRKEITDENVVVINPETDLPYFFNHVDSNSTATSVNGVVGDGTVENPYKVFADAQGGSQHDIIFVHADSQFTGVNVNLESDVRVLGDASNVLHVVNTNAMNSTSGYGSTLLLPHVIAAGSPGERPIFADAPGDGVTLANRSEFSGFQIIDPTLRGIVGDGIIGSTTHSTVRQTDVSGSGLAAVFLNNTQGTVRFEGNTINDPSSNANTFFVNGTQGTVVFTEDLLTPRNASGALVPTPGVINNVEGTGGRALVIQGTAAGSTVDFTRSTVNDENAQGVLVQNSAGFINLGNLNVTNGTGIGLNILNNSGIITSNGTITIDGSAGDAINIEGLTAGSSVNFNNNIDSNNSNGFDINILNRQGRGIFIHDNAGTDAGPNITFTTGTSVAAADSNVTRPAIEYQGNSKNVTFNNVRITNGSEGIVIGELDSENTGRFTVNGDTLISNLSGIGINIFDDSSTVLFNGGFNTASTTINGRGDIGIAVRSNRGPVTFNGTTTINNQNGSNLPGLDIRGNSDLRGTVTFQTLNVQNAAGPAAAGFNAIGVNIGDLDGVRNRASVVFNSLNIGNLGAATEGTAFYAENVGSTIGALVPSGLTIGQGTIAALGGTAVDIRNSAINVNLTSVSSAASTTTTPQYGINLVNNHAINATTIPLLDNFIFTVGALPPNPQTVGGTITDASIAGINVEQTDTNLIQTGSYRFRSMTILDNTVGIRASDILQLEVANSNISSNIGGLGVQTGVGIDASNVMRVDIQSSQFNLNGTDEFDHAIFLHATRPLAQPQTTTVLPTNGKYVWNITNNTNTNGFLGGFVGAAGTGDLVRVSGTRGDLETIVNTIPIQTFGVPLVFQFDNNAMLVQAGDVGRVSGVNVDWTGQIDSNSVVDNINSSMSNNIMNLQGFNNAFAIQNATTRYTTNFAIQGNTITGINGANTGIFVNNFSQTNLSIGRNLMTFTTPPVNANLTLTDLGTDISITNSTARNSFVDIFDNEITMTQGPLNQGMLFRNIQAPASFAFNGNIINITGAQPILGQGINFSLVTGAPVTLSGVRNNIVNINGNGVGITSQNWYFEQPTNSTFGQFLINGFSGP
ncbi:inverse autotransporter beta domain-containing protein [Schlesneria sp. T3-172]|uniref:inverse autotransporter beta domain-containing protein n=1 Tax=Schlesneria sphaerica TaxID=3373610 RepID=UPI0037C5D3FF